MKPILFNTEMVQAILDGRKTVTRRIAKPQPLHGTSIIEYGKEMNPPYRPGDVLYVRETWKAVEASSAGWCVIEYKAGGKEKFNEIITLPTCNGKWKPSIHMPKEAARLFLRVVYARVRWLRDMCLADVLMEGIQEAESYEETWDRWHSTWNSTIKPADVDKYGWEANPLVWVIKFERISKKEAYRE